MDIKTLRRKARRWPGKPNPYQGASSDAPPVRENPTPASAAEVAELFSRWWLRI